MDNDTLRSAIVQLLGDSQAHVSFDQALADLAPKLRSKRPPGGVHSVWELVEHMRIGQEDILHYTVDPQWASPPWPQGYWPDNPDTLPETRWQDSINGFRADRQALIGLAQDVRLELTTAIPHGEGRTYLRQLLMAADHNAYHLGQIVDVRRALGDWPSS
jgi:uncharacterized damage-inducible protein DinB